MEWQIPQYLAFYVHIQSLDFTLKRSSFPLQKPTFGINVTERETSIDGWQRQWSTQAKV